ncbi:MAG TPA: di-heme oxidoredictase family protein [Kofleriaceae bacterium]|nr:di-heme oxidoredictase family protein [Kofleriaceae bacterium]
MVFIILVGAALVPACVDDGGPSGDPPSTITNASDVPIDGLSAADVAEFERGDDAFDLPFRPVDGLGPYFIRTSCGACHGDGSRGPGLVQKMAIVEEDGVTASPDQSALPYGHTIRQGLSAGAMTPLVAPMVPEVLVTIRLGPPVFGRGYLEAVSDDELRRVAAEEAARTDGIHGRLATATFASVPSGDGFSSYQTGDPVIGRFGLKARVATLDDFTADAFQGDMGLTTPMRPAEPANPDGLADDLRAGVDLDQAHVDRVAFYLRRIAIPRRVGLTDRGAALFDQVACSGCHTPSLHTRADYPIPQLADLDAPVFTDLLLHDMGDGLADGMTDGGGDSRTWRTAPLIGLRFSKLYLHDGRASTVTDAIRAHGGEAAGSVAAFDALSPADRDALVAYVEAL